MGPLQPQRLLFLLFPIFLCRKIFNIHLVVSDSIQITGTMLIPILEYDQR